MPSRRCRDSILLRRSWREGKRTLKETLANSADLPADIVGGFEAVPCGGAAFPALGDAVAVRKKIPAPRQYRRRCRERDIAAAAIAARVVAPDSKLAAARRQAETIRGRCGIRRIALPGDLGMIAAARILEDIRPADLDRVPALRAADLRKQVGETGRTGPALVPENLADDAAAEVAGARPVVRLNPRLREERARKSET